MIPLPGAPWPPYDGPPPDLPGGPLVQAKADPQEATAGDPGRREDPFRKWLPFGLALAAILLFACGALVIWDSARLHLHRLNDQATYILAALLRFEAAFPLFRVAPFGGSVFGVARAGPAAT